MPLKLVRPQESRPDRTTLIAAVLALAIALYVILVSRGANDAAALSPGNADSASTAADSATNAVNQLTALALELPAVPDAAFDRQQVPVGLRQIAAVLDAVMPRDSAGASAYATVPADLRSAADRLEREGSSANGGVIARSAFVSTSEVVRLLQRRDYPHLERAAAGLQDAALAIRADRAIVEQRSKVEQFFQRASDAFRGMAGSS
jgi:hypothetical protein